ncbi:unnamed protein product [Polarella glacialis]|uniref:Uncharacterized protein n=1 Tax=Polarella glacialis TaxID=89957 RepID=A0A813EU45_POLGL|nr:unnamed protein product [Polarella glacialis]
MAPKSKFCRGKFSWILKSDPKVHPVPGNIFGAYLTFHRGKRQAISGMKSWMETWVQDASPARFFIWDSEGDYEVDVIEEAAFSFAVDASVLPLHARGVLSAGPHAMQDDEIVESVGLASAGVQSLRDLSDRGSVVCLELQQSNSQAEASTSASAAKSSPEKSAPTAKGSAKKSAPAAKRSVKKPSPGRSVKKQNSKGSSAKASS